MANDNQRVAILLRGRQCAGKTEVARSLLDGKEPVSLDDGNYNKLRTCDDVLVLELGYGETPGRPPGPTRDPGKWQGVLTEEHRSLYAFFLTADRSVREARAVHSGRNVSIATLNASDELHSWPEVALFAKWAGICEHEIDTSLKSATQVADHIREIVKSVHPGLRWPSKP